MATKTARAKPQSDQRPSAHDFAQDLASWESSIFINADYFVVGHRVGVGQYERVELKTWPEVKIELLAAPRGRRLLIYSITASGRSVCLNGPKLTSGHWDALWERWRAKDRPQARS